MYKMNATPFLIFVTILPLGTPQTCNTFDNVETLITKSDGDKFNQFISGCIDRTNFPGKPIWGVHVTNQRVEKLYKGSVKDMKDLRVVSLINCDTGDIQPFAFSNVPYLKAVRISQCKLTTIKTDTFTSFLTPSLETLQLDNNEINDIEDGTFSYLLGMKTLDLNNNRLGFWRSEWFQNADALETIDLRHNRIREIPDRAFAKLISLKKIRLDFNDIKRIKNEAFRGKESLEHLGLANNKLTALDSRSFPDKLSIKTLRIHANHLNFLSIQLLDKLTVNNLYMDYNPWNCECLHNIHTWLIRKNVKTVLEEVCKGSHIPVCAISQRSSQGCDEIVDDEITRRYINTLRSFSTPLDPTCARLD